MRRESVLPLGTRATYGLAAYLAYGIAAMLLVPVIVAYTQAHGFTTFYELAPDEAPGPLGDIDRVLFDIKIDYVLFIVVVTPIFWQLRGSWLLYASLFFCNEPLLSIGYLLFFRLTDH